MACKIGDIMIKRSNYGFKFVIVTKVLKTKIYVKTMFSGYETDYWLTGNDMGIIAEKKHTYDKLYHYDNTGIIEEHKEYCLECVISEYKKKIKTKFNKILDESNNFNDLQELANMLQFFKK